MNTQSNSRSGGADQVSSFKRDMQDVLDCSVTADGLVLAAELVLHFGGHRFDEGQQTRALEAILGHLRSDIDVIRSTAQEALREVA